MGAGQTLDSMAELLYRAGDLAGARARSVEQLQMARETGSRTLRSWALQGLARVQAASGSLREARRSLELALAEATATGELLRVMQVRNDLAGLALAEGDAEGAARTAAETAAWWRERGNTWGEAEASAILAQALAERGRRDEALAAVERARVLAEESEDRALALAVAPRLALARMVADGVDARQALADVARAAEEARRRGFAVAALEARLAEGRIELGQGAPAGRARIEEVRREARERGLGLLARAAAEALSLDVPPPPLG
jgi:tetratricopeptide (TPR) repeat protein